MKQYITRRLLQMIPVLIGISIVIFFIFTLAPGDALSGQINPHMTAERKAELRHMMHLDQPKIVQYKYWVSGVIKGNLGESSFYKKPVTSVIGDYLMNSFYLSIVSFILSLLIAIPIGVISATKQYSLFDGFFTVFAMIGISIPSFFFAFLLLKWFAVDIQLFPVSGMYSTGSTLTGFPKFMDLLWHMFLPTFILTFMSIGGWMRYIRSSMLEVIRQDYIRTARAKGLAEKVVIYKHALRNGLIPIITLIGLSLPGLFSGALFTEMIFNWPGIGPIELIAVNNRDYYLLMGLNMFMAALTLLGNLIADIMYAWVDPRVRLK